jgi:hypothetical protein
MKKKEKELMLLQQQEQHQYHGDVAVIHIGPHKTGTTTIQHMIKDYYDTLVNQDGYYIPMKLE